MPVAFTDNHYFLAALISTRFAVTGVVIGSNEMLSWAPCIALRMVTVTGGGILLDILASRISKVLSTQPNVSGSLIGRSVN